MDRVTLQIESDGVAILTMADVEGRNAFSTAFTAQLTARLEEVSVDERARVCVVAGLHDIFCAGGDREVLLRLAEGGLPPYDLTLTRTLLEVPIPTIAAMAGPAVGGGLVFGLCCDVVVMARQSRYGCNFMDLGFTPGMGTTQLIQAAVGEYTAAEMMYGGQYFRGSHFAGRGVNHVVARDEVVDKALSIARRFADKPRYALALLKRTLALPRRQAFEAARTLESLMHEVCFARPETTARIRENYLTTGDPTGSGTEDR